MEILLVFSHLHELLCVIIVKTNGSWAVSDNKQKDYTMLALKGTFINSSHPN